MNARLENQVKNFSDTVGAQIEGQMYRIENGADEIYVRESVDGAVGRFSLADLPGKKAIAHAFRLFRRVFAGGEIVQVKEGEN